MYSQQSMPRPFHLLQTVAGFMLRWVMFWQVNCKKKNVEYTNKILFHLFQDSADCQFSRKKLGFTDLWPTYKHRYTAGNRHKQNSWFCKEIREDNFRFWWRRVHEDALQGMYMSKIEICLNIAKSENAMLWRMPFYCDYYLKVSIHFKYP
jgi:hypothetical protein